MMMDHFCQRHALLGLCWTGLDRVPLTGSAETSGFGGAVTADMRIRDVLVP